MQSAQVVILDFPVISSNFPGMGNVSGSPAKNILHTQYYQKYPPLYNKHSLVVDPPHHPHITILSASHY